MRFYRPACPSGPAKIPSCGGKATAEPKRVLVHTPTPPHRAQTRPLGARDRRISGTPLRGQGPPCPPFRTREKGGSGPLLHPSMQRSVLRLPPLESETDSPLLGTISPRIKNYHRDAHGKPPPERSRRSPPQGRGGAEPAGAGLRGALPGRSQPRKRPAGSPPSADPVWGEGAPLPRGCPRGGADARPSHPSQHLRTNQNQAKTLPPQGDAPRAQERRDATRPACGPLLPQGLATRTSLPVHKAAGGTTAQPQVAAGPEDTRPWSGHGASGQRLPGPLRSFQS